jgi:hypothetical protein
VLRRPSPEQGRLNLFLVLCHKLSKPGEAEHLVVEAVGLYQPITVERMLSPSRRETSFSS